MLFKRKPAHIVGPDEALPGRAESMPVTAGHFVNGRSLTPPYPDRMAVLDVGMGCFWGAERLYWTVDGVHVTAVGYAGGHTPNPTYEEVCSGMTGHTEAVRIVYDPEVVSDEALMKLFWENHDPTQGMRQGNDTGTQYRSAIYWHTDGQRRAAETTAESFQSMLTAAGLPTITTEMASSSNFYFAEDYHQQYLAKNPRGYCGLAGVGVSCPTGVMEKTT
ncbi:peptide-methionine (S)-S-oxide reductase MsrA [Fodinicurvata sp. EGI_FJ10296]|uniref:peptide-methionine (S)-S-oxide reductase MsrA n=1 Tax=Fodinicurvata sp. EGI_FJ10296 TaxID=3231908 RepID=UPI003455C7B8